MTKPQLRERCRRLRLEERLSLREIQEATGASKGSLSQWLRDIPLTEEELAERRKKQRRHIPPRKDRGPLSQWSLLIEERSPNQKAKIAEAAVMFRAMCHGLAVFGSVFEGEKADWVVVRERDKKALKVQVKLTRRCSTGLPTVSLRSSSRYEKYLAEEVDFIIGYNPRTDRCYIWAWDELKSLSSTVSICDEAEERWDKIL